LADAESIRNDVRELLDRVDAVGGAAEVLQDTHDRPLGLQELDETIRVNVCVNDDSLAAGTEDASEESAEDVRSDAEKEQGDIGMG